jgi:K+-sensing histidine kinase KdpD
MGNIQQATEKLRLSNDRHQNAIDLAESASKEKEAFIRSVSHQVRTPLNIIMGYASVLYESLKANRSTPEDQNEFEKENMAEISQTIKRNAFLLKRMVFMLYDSSEEQATEEKKSKREDELSCNEIARESISYIKTHHPGIRIRFNTTIPNSTFILTNKVYLEGTLRELLNNAAIHSDKKHIQMHVVKSEAKILFIVEDTGPGLPKDALYMLDKPFTKMDEMSEGLGLGLPLCKRHAVNLGGDLILDTSYQSGCRFILELPR